MHAAGLASDASVRDDAFLLGLMGQQLAAHRVANGVDVRQVRPHLVVDEDLAASAEAEAKRGRIDAGETRLAANRHENVVALERSVDPPSFCISTLTRVALPPPPVTRTPVRRSRPCFLNTFSVSLDHVGVVAGENRGGELERR